MKYLRQCASNTERSPKVNWSQVNQIVSEQIADIDRNQKWKGILHHLLADTKHCEGALSISRANNETKQAGYYWKCQGQILEQTVCVTIEKLKSAPYENPCYLKEVKIQD